MSVRVKHYEQIEIIKKTVTKEIGSHLFWLYLSSWISTWCKQARSHSLLVRRCFLSVLVHLFVCLVGWLVGWLFGWLVRRLWKCQVELRWNWETMKMAFTICLRQMMDKVAWVYRKKRSPHTQKHSLFPNNKCEFIISMNWPMVIMVILCA